MTVTFYQSSLGNCREGHTNSCAGQKVGLLKNDMVIQSKVQWRKWYSVLFQDNLEGKNDWVDGGMEQGEEEVTGRVSVKQG